MAFVGIFFAYTALNRTSSEPHVGANKDVDSKCMVSGVLTKGAVDPTRSRRGRAKQPHKNFLTTTKVSLMKFAERAISSLSQQTITTHLVYLALMLFFVSTFMYWCGAVLL